MSNFHERAHQLGAEIAMMQEYDKAGGAAFPIDTANLTFYGMSMRDYFAAQALNGCLSYSHYNEQWGDYHNNGTHESLASYCYKVADAMIKARSAAHPSEENRTTY